MSIWTPSEFPFEGVPDAATTEARAAEGTFSAEKAWTSCGTVLVFRQKVTLEDAIRSHACSLEALACV
jgi:hypothetical protein